MLFHLKFVYRRRPRPRVLRLCARARRFFSSLHQFLSCFGCLPTPHCVAWMLHVGASPSAIQTISLLCVLLHETTMNSNNDVLFSFIRYFFPFLSCSFIVFMPCGRLLCSVVSGDASSIFFSRRLCQPLIKTSSSSSSSSNSIASIKRRSSERVRFSFFFPPHIYIALHLIVNSQMSLEIIIPDWWCLRFVSCFFHYYSYYIFSPFGGEFADTNLAEE